MAIDKVVDCKCKVGEAPLWHTDERKLYWVDIPNGRLFRYDPETGDYEQCYEGEPLGAFSIQQDGSLLLFQSEGSVRLFRDGEVSVVVPPKSTEADAQFNDVVADPGGRVFIGEKATDKHLGRLFRLNRDGSMQRVLDGVGQANGMGFSPDRKLFYFTDTHAQDIYVFDYEEISGNIYNRRLFVHVSGEDNGKPDGMTVDIEGCIWSAHWGCGCVVRYSPEGNELDRIQLPVKSTSCPTFGGNSYADLYITTATKQDSSPDAGSLFRVKVAVPGKPEYRSNVQV